MHPQPTRTREDTVKRLALTCIALLFSGSLAAADLSNVKRQIERGLYSDALGALNDHLANEPQDAEARFLRGVTLVMLDRRQDAIRTFADLTRDFPELPEPYNNLAVLYAREGQYEKARDALEAALSNHPSYATAHENLGDIYAALAGAAYNRALVLDKNNQGLRVKLNVLNQMSTLDGAAATSLQAAPAAPAAIPQPSAPTAPAPAIAAAADQATINAVTGAAQAWAKAWSDQNADAYLRAYSPNFRPPRGISRSAWEAQRRDRIAAPASISVQLLNPTVVMQGSDRARVSFIQIYESNTYADQVRKVLEMERSGGRWLITRESVTSG